MKLLIALIGFGSAQSTYKLPSDIVDDNLPLDGPYWSQWSEWYGCSQFKYDEFCRFKNKAQLKSRRYKVCVYPKGKNYAEELLQGMYLTEY